MGFFRRLFGIADTSTPANGEEHAVLLHFRLKDVWPTEEEMKRYHDLQDRLEGIIQAARAGELDGDEFGGGECVVYMYGPDAEKLWDAIAPVLEKEAIPKGSWAIKRFGGPNCGREERINLHWDG